MHTSIQQHDLRTGQFVRELTIADEPITSTSTSTSISISISTSTSTSINNVNVNVNNANVAVNPKSNPNPNPNPSLPEGSEAICLHACGPFLFVSCTGPTPQVVQFDAAQGVEIQRILLPQLYGARFAT
jgi:hypothetical protein